MRISQIVTLNPSTKGEGSRRGEAHLHPPHPEILRRFAPQNDTFRQPIAMTTEIAKRPETE